VRRARPPAPSDLAEYLDQQIAPRGAWKSARALSQAAGLNQNAVGTIIANGRADPESLAPIARVLKISPLRLYVLSRWLTEAEAGMRLSDEEQGLIDRLHELPDDDQEFARGMWRAVLDEQLARASRQATG
jgi:hypothetical protein